jgi:hypothetical protein
MASRGLTASLVLGWALWATGAPAQQDVLFSETFTGPYQSTPSGWLKVNTPEGNFWYLRDGSYTSGNGDTILSQDKRTYSVVAAGAHADWRNYEVVTDAYMIQRIGSLMLVGRWQDAANHYEGVYETNDGVVTVRIVRVLNGRNETLAQLTSRQDPSLPNLANGATPADGRRFRLVFLGDQIRFYIDQRQVLSATDDTFHAGTAGVGQSENYVFFDNFRVVGEQMAVAATPTAPTAPAAPAPSEEVQRVFRLVVAEGWTRQQARDYKRALEEMGFLPVVIRESGPGKYDVLTGTFLSRDEAERRGQFLLSEGDLISYRVMEIRGAGAAQQELAAAAEAPAAYAVEVATTPDRREADAARDYLMQELDYFPVAILDQGNTYGIYVGNFSEESEANRLIPEFADEGFPFAKVVQANRQELIEATAVPEASLGQEVLAGLSPEERSRVEQVVTQQRALSRGSNTAEEIRAMQDLLTQLRQDYGNLRERVVSIQGQAEQREEMRRQINTLVAQAESDIDNRNWESADQIISNIFALDAGNATARLLQSRVQAARQSTAQGTPEQDVDHLMAQASQLEQQHDLEGALAVLRDAERRYPSVTRIGVERRRVQSEVNVQRQREEDERNRQLTEAMQARQRQNTRMLLIIIGAFVALVLVTLYFLFRLMGQEKTLRSQVSTLAATGHLPAGIGGGHPSGRVKTEPIIEGAAEESGLMPDPLAFGGGAGEEGPASLRGGRQAEFGGDNSTAYGPISSGQGIGLNPAEANQSVSALASMVMGTLEATSDRVAKEPPLIFAKGAKEGPPPRKPATSPRAEKEKPKPAVAPTGGRVALDFGSDSTPVGAGSGADHQEMEIMSFDETPAGKRKPAVAAAEPPPAEEPPRPAEPPRQVAPAPSAADPFADLLSSESEGPQEAPAGLDFDIGLEEPPAAAEAKAAPRPVTDDVTQPLSTDILDEAFGDINAPPSAVPPPTPMEEKVTAPAPVDDGKIIFEQHFTPDEAGRQPGSWVGSYDFASLQVVTEHAPPGSSACLRFEKRSGAGSAFYTCHFPDATGVVGVEFDLCCESKNQYLLGLYFEHNENFRQSVHTVIHRTDETVTLRLQGKSAPYTFGQWVHVRFRIDLKAGLVEGYVDNRPVAVGVPLLSMADQAMPSSINTISIRDTLASEGVFLLDKIRVYRV